MQDAPAHAIMKVKKEVRVVQWLCAEGCAHRAAEGVGFHTPAPQGRIYPASLNQSNWESLETAINEMKSVRGTVCVSKGERDYD